jgi:hypothetical protein
VHTCSYLCCGLTSEWIHLKPMIDICALMPVS